MSRLDPYKAALAALSERTGTKLPSLLLSFGILHEVTAVLPLIGGFYAARGLGLGETAVHALANTQVTEHTSPFKSWTVTTMNRWVYEGEAWAGRIGRRYGAFGIEKGANLEGERDETGNRAEIAGDVANAVLAYGFAKAILPLRLGLSAYLAPSMSRRVMEPMQRGIMRVFRRGRG